MTRFVLLALVIAAIPAMSMPANGTPLGEKLFRANCIGCHSINCNRNGPRLKNVLGRKAGSMTDFSYSDALKNSGIVWSESTLDEFLSDPAKMVPGTAMSTVSVKSAEERRQIIAFVKKQDTSVDICL